MKLGKIGVLAGTVATVLFSGCASERYATTGVYRTEGYASTRSSREPVFVERRTVVVDNTPRYVPVYRTGTAYYYTWDGRRYAIDDYPRFRRTSSARYQRDTAITSTRYRDLDRTVVCADLDGDNIRTRRIRSRGDADFDDRVRCRNASRVDQDGPDYIGERVRERRREVRD